MVEELAIITAAVLASGFGGLSAYFYSEGKKGNGSWFLTLSLFNSMMFIANTFY